MPSNIIDIFYYFMPGAFYILSNLYLFNNFVWEKVLNNSMEHSGELLVFIILVFSFILGLFFEGLSKIWLDPETQEKEKYYQINRWLWFHKKRELPEYFSSRASFYRNMTIPLLLIILSVCGSSIDIIESHKEIISFFIIITFAISMKSFVHYKNKELEVLKGFKKDRFYSRLNV